MDKINKKTAVMYGAGNIGRGFIGQVFHDSGYEVVFIDVNQDVVSALNSRHSYYQLIIDGDITTRREITGVRAVDGRDHDVVAREISDCDIMAVSVGAAILQRIAPLIAEGLSRRKLPLNILICENLAHAPVILKNYISEYISEPKIVEKVGFIGATIGRMVPVMPQEERTADPTAIAVEPFCSLPLDKEAVIMPMPELSNVILCSPFAFQESKKLYIHNMGHALAAYFGALKNNTYIWQSMVDENIREQVKSAMTAAAKALARKYNENESELQAYVEDLLRRFSNKGLGDTVARVGGDPMRKLAPEDRLMGAIDICREQNIDYRSILSGVAAALRFDVPGDPSAGILREHINNIGIITFLRDECRLPESDAVKCDEIYDAAKPVLKTHP